MLLMLLFLLHLGGGGGEACVEAPRTEAPLAFGARVQLVKHAPEQRHNPRPGECAAALPK